MKKIGLGIIGTGFWGKNHARVYDELPNANLVAICDINSNRAKEIANLYNVKAFTDSSQMLQEKEIDAVSVCTWSTRLAKEALKCLNSGKHVLVEKPMATTLKDAETLLETSRQNGLHLSVGFLMRFIPGLQQIRKAIEKKEIGDLISATAKRVSEWPERVGDVGVVKDTAIHDIDVMRYISKETPISVYAKIGNMKNRKFEDYAHIMLTYEDNKTAFIESNWFTPYKTRKLTITGTDSIMKLDYIKQELWIESKKETVQPRYNYQEPLKLELQHFIDCILTKCNPIVTGVDGLEALKVAIAAQNSSAKNVVIKL